MSLWMSHKQYATGIDDCPVECLGFLHWQYEDSEALDDSYRVKEVKCDACDLIIGVIERGAK